MTSRQPLHPTSQNLPSKPSNLASGHKKPDVQLPVRVPGKNNSLFSLKFSQYVFIEGPNDQSIFDISFTFRFRLQ